MPIYYTVTSFQLSVSSFQLYDLPSLGIGVGGSHKQDSSFNVQLGKGCGA